MPPLSGTTICKSPCSGTYMATARLDQERVVPEAPLVAAQIEEGGVIEVERADLLWLSSASSAQTGQRAEIRYLSGNDNGSFIVTLVRETDHRGVR